MRRPSNPRMVAKALPAAARGAKVAKRSAKVKKKEGSKKVKPALPASVTMRAAEVVRGDGAARPGAKGAEWGIVYRLVVQDANGRPIGGGVYTIRRHVLPVKSTGSFGTASGGAQISVVRLEEDGTALDFVGVAEAKGEAATSATSATSATGATGAAATRKAGAKGRDERGAGDGEEKAFEYFSFELGGVTYAIPRSGFVLTKKRRAGRIDVSRAPLAGGSVHGAVVAGLVEDGGGDVYSFHLE